jgi:type I restriction enzyme S subunit
MFDQLATILVGSTFKRINVADIKALVVALPPRAEQASIAGCLDNELGDIDTAIGVCRSEQALLREYRTRLIADVVTGKLDVREAAGRLPEEADEPGALEEADVPIDDGEDALDDLAAVFQEPDA